MTAAILTEALDRGTVRQPYSHRDHRKLRVLLRRAAWLAGRNGVPPNARAFELQELGAIRWALDQIIAIRGALPDDIETKRGAVWPVTP